jgi:hypothetical protein
MAPAEDNPMRTSIPSTRPGAAIAACLAAAAMLAASVLAGRAHAAAGHCNRACLDRMVDDYLAALVAHDPAKVPIAADARFVENTVPMRPGEGLWQTASEVPTTFKITVADPVAEQVGFIGVMQESGKPIEIGLRLKIRDGKITEMEHLIARNLRPASLRNLQAPRPAFLEKVPPAKRTPRAEMLKIAYSYYTALVTGNGHAAPFADDCVRHENGMQTTGNTAHTETPVGKSGSMAKLGSPGRAAARLDRRSADRACLRAFPVSPADEKEIREDRRRRGARAGADELQAVRSARCAHLQDLRREDPRDRGDGLHDALRLEDRLGEVTARALAGAAAGQARGQ